MGEMLDVAFDAALDRLERQEGTLDSIRARVGTIVSTASLAASFLGAAFIRDRDTGVLFWLGTVGFLLAIGIGLLLLRPRENWYFSPNIKDLLDHYLSGDPADAKQQLTAHMAGWIDDNQANLKDMLSMLSIAIGALGTALFLWFLELAI